MLINAKQLNLALHGLDERFIKYMTAFLRGPCLDAARLTLDEEADIDVFDYDVIPSKRLFEKALQDGLLKPAIVLSLYEYSRDGVIYLKKPVAADEMLQVLEQAKKLAEKVTKITVEYGITKIPQISLQAGDSASRENKPQESDELQQISDWFDKALV